MTTQPRSRRVDRPTATDVKLLHVATLAVLVSAVVGLAPGPLGTAGAVGAVAVAIAAPVLRVVRLAVRWGGNGDVRFALAGAGLVSVLVGGAVIAAATA